MSGGEDEFFVDYRAAAELRMIIIALGSEQQTRLERPAAGRGFHAANNEGDIRQLHSRAGCQAERARQDSCFLLADMVARPIAACPQALARRANSRQREQEPGEFCYQFAFPPMLFAPAKFRMAQNGQHGKTRRNGRHA